MEVKPTSTKRKQPSDGPFDGTFTRSRSEIFLHRNRSGRSRSDPNRTTKIQRSEAIDDDPHISIKDLRTRRVFSPASISDECYLEEKNCKIGTEVDDIRTELPEIGEKLCHGEQKNVGDGEILGEDWLQTTPPNDDVFCKSAAEPDRGNAVGFDLQSTDRAVENASSRSISGFDPTAKEPNNPPKNRLGLVPCSRSKLYQTPCSFSYRRLLPFIMDLAKENSIAMEIHPCQKVEKIGVARSLPLLSASPLGDSSISGANTNSLPAQHNSGGPRLSVHPPSSSFVNCPNIDPSKQPVTEIPSQNPPEHLVLPTTCYTLKSMPRSPYNECIPQAHQVISEDIPIFPKISIFSPASGSNTCYPDIKEKIGEDMDDIKAKLSEIAKEGNFDAGCSYQEQKLDGDGEILGGADCLREEWFQTTPPDGDIFYKARVEEDQGNTVGFNLQSTDRAMENPSNKNISDFFHAEKEPKNPSKNIVGLVPCSRSKLFRTPSSFSYRRLLPFLMDITNENSGALETHPFEEVEKIMTEKSLLPTLASLSHDISMDGAEAESSTFEEVEKITTEKSLLLTPASLSHDISMDGAEVESSTFEEVEKITLEKSLLLTPASLSDDISMDGAEVESSPMRHKLGELGGSPTSNSEDKAITSRLSEVKCPNLDLSKRPIRETPIESMFLSTTYGTTTAIPLNSCSERASLVHQVKSESSCNPELCSEPVDSIYGMELPNKTASFLPITHQLLSNENCSYNMQDTSHLFGRDEEDCTALTTLNTDVRPPETSNIHRSASPQHPVLFKRSTLTPTNGILKKYPQQCKGLCMCLECTSFRLHAEKAYEFSRKQMQDAEGIAMGLMKELSCLRNLMEKSIAATVDSAEDQAAVQMNKAKAACRRASRTEELAKTQLRQMTCDLNLRCRITRRRVRFANDVEKKHISKFETEYIG